MKHVLSLILSLLVSGQAFAQDKIPTETSTPVAKGTFTKTQAKEILKTAEEIRSLDEAEIMVTLTTQAGDKKTAYEMKILRAPGKRAFIDFLAPAEEKGRRMLAVDGKYWSTFPDSNKVVAISRKEMIGNSAFAIADIFQLDSEKDYDPEIIERKTVNGVSVLVLDLKAKSEEAPYAAIKYFVEEKGYFPILAYFYGPSGKHLKTMSVESRKEIAGRMRPEVAKMDDKVTAKKASWWHTRAMKGTKIPEGVFTKDYLKSAK